MVNLIKNSHIHDALQWCKTVCGNLSDPYRIQKVFLASSDRWMNDRIRKWQLKQVNNLIAIALSRVPGHAKKFVEAGITQPLENLNELSRLPFMTKEELREDSHRFMDSTKNSAFVRAVTSGGTTGVPTRFMADAYTYDRVFDAWRHAMWRRAGYVPGDCSLDLTWAFDTDIPLRAAPDAGRTYLSIHALTEENCDMWLGPLVAMQPKFIIGFPSTAASFARLVPTGALRGVRAILLASETLTALQKNVLLATFAGARIFCWYGMAEMAVFASYCEDSDTFHHWPQSGIMEIINEDGMEVINPGESGEIVVTGFANTVTPFIRYRTGDRATVGEPCLKCGRPNRILATLNGRINEVLISARQRIVPLSALNFHSDEFRQVLSHQYVQLAPGVVVIKIVPLRGFRGVDQENILRLLNERIGQDFTIRIEIVADIPRTHRGKQPLIIQGCNT